MSYQRYGYPLKYFKTGVSDNYVFSHVDGYIEDYGSDYKDDKSLVELIGDIIERETGNEDYAWKIVKVLAKKLKIDKDLRKRDLK